MRRGRDLDRGNSRRRISTPGVVADGWTWARGRRGGGWAGGGLGKHDLAVEIFKKQSEPLNWNLMAEDIFFETHDK